MNLQIQWIRALGLPRSIRGRNAVHLQEYTHTKAGGSAGSGKNRFIFTSDGDPRSRSSLTTVSYLLNLSGPTMADCSPALKSSSAEPARYSIRHNSSRCNHRYRSFSGPCGYCSIVFSFDHRLANCGYQLTSSYPNTRRSSKGSTYWKGGMSQDVLCRPINACKLPDGPIGHKQVVFFGDL